MDYARLSKTVGIARPEIMLLPEALFSAGASHRDQPQESP
jgi:hypothetical protein